VLARGQFSPFFLAADARFIYWTTGDSRIMRVAKAGGTPEQLTPEFSTALVVDDDAVFYGTQRAIRRIAKDTGQIVTIAELSEDPVEMVSDGQSLFFTMFDGSFLGKVAKTGGQVQKLLLHVGGSSSLAVDDDALFVASYREGTIRKLAKGGGAVTVVASGLHKPLGLAADADHLFVASEKDGTVLTLPRSGGTPVVLAGNQFNQDILALDGSHVYWLSWAHGSDPTVLRKVAKTGGPIVTLAEGFQSPQGLLVDGPTIYVSNSAAGTIERFPLR
jgi:hypothetical protein